jgi:hypothetical protein
MLVQASETRLIDEPMVNRHWIAVRRWSCGAADEGLRSLTTTPTSSTR